MIISPSSSGRSPRIGPSASLSPRMGNRYGGDLPNVNYSPHSGMNLQDFQVERSGPRQYPPATRRTTMPQPEIPEDDVLGQGISRLLAAKTRPYVISGRIPFDPANLNLFFRSKAGITHSLDFPIDVEYDTPPALDVLIAACKPHISATGYDYPDRDCLFYPPALPLTTTLELANHPILDTIRASLFPNLQPGYYLTAVRDRLDVIVNGGRMNPLARVNDGREVTLLVTLPVKFRGGALVVRDLDGSGEQLFYGNSGKPSGGLEWTAFYSNHCDYEVETVSKGCKITLSYAVYLRTFGGGPGALQDPLISPSDFFLDLLTPILNLSRGRKIAFYLSNEYGVNPSEVLAESLVPSLKGGDLLLYHALKLFKLTPELHWTAGRYIWPVDRIVECQNELPNEPTSAILTSPRSGPNTANPGVRGAFSIYSDPHAHSPRSRAHQLPHNEEAEKESLRFRVEDSGAILLSEAGVDILTDLNLPGGVGKERVPFVSQGELEKLIVNTLMAVYVP